MLYINNEMTYYLCAKKEKKKKWLIIYGIVSCIVELTLRTNLELALVGADSGQDAPWGTTGEQCIEIFTKIWVLDKVPWIDLDHDLMIKENEFFLFQSLEVVTNYREWAQGWAEVSILPSEVNCFWMLLLAAVPSLQTGLYFHLSNLTL